MSSAPLKQRSAQAAKIAGEGLRIRAGAVEEEEQSAKQGGSGEGGGSTTASYSGMLTASLGSSCNFNSWF